MSSLCFSRLRFWPNKLTSESNPTLTKLGKLQSEVWPNPTNILFHSRLIINNLSSLLQRLCCKLNCFDLSYLLVLAQSAVLRPFLTTDYFNCLTKTAVQAILMIACIVLSTDNFSHFIFFVCLGMPPIENRLPVDVTSLAKFFFQYPGLLLEKALAVQLQSRTHRSRAAIRFRSRKWSW